MSTKRPRRMKVIPRCSVCSRPGGDTIELRQGRCIRCRNLREQTAIAFASSLVREWVDTPDHPSFDVEALNTRAIALTDDLLDQLHAEES